MLSSELYKQRGRYIKLIPRYSARKNEYILIDTINGQMMYHPIRGRFPYLKLSVGRNRLNNTFVLSFHRYTSVIQVSLPDISKSNQEARCYLTYSTYYDIICPCFVSTYLIHTCQIAEATPEDIKQSLQDFQDVKDEIDHTILELKSRRTRNRFIDAVKKVIKSSRKN